ncbi:hypothetical protein LEP1GSC086_1799 [Leptospira weilii str. LNT 1234]|nr:hypothetical protein LEP1GSC086_1799 [Leptospira weilii str. LNT 1234]
MNHANSRYFKACPKRRNNYSDSNKIEWFWDGLLLKVRNPFGNGFSKFTEFLHKPAKLFPKDRFIVAHSPYRPVL